VVVSRSVMPPGWYPPLVRLRLSLWGVLIDGGRMHARCADAPQKPVTFDCLAVCVWVSRARIFGIVSHVGRDVNGEPALEKL
jgi:hypothetical protein